LRACFCTHKASQNAALRASSYADNRARGHDLSSRIVLSPAPFFFLCCANFCNLLLARGVARQREVAIRLALGAGRLRLLRQLLTESVLLSLIGGLVRLLIAFWMTPLLGALSPIQAVSLSNSLSDFCIDARVLTFSLLVSLSASVAFGLIPALKAARSGDLMMTLKQGGQRSGGISADRRWLRSDLC
jgi:hypothetical protein